MRKTPNGTQTVLHFIISGLVLIGSGSAYLSFYQKALDNLPKIVEETPLQDNPVEIQEEPITEETIVGEEPLVVYFTDEVVFPQETVYDTNEESLTNEEALVEENPVVESSDESLVVEASVDTE